MSSLVAERRAGTFSIRWELIEDTPDLAQAIFNNVIVVRAEYMAMSHGIEYTAYSHAFDSVDESQKPPGYVALFHRSHDEQGIAHDRFSGWKRVDR